MPHPPHHRRHPHHPRQRSRNDDPHHHLRHEKQHRLTPDRLFPLRLHNPSHPPYPDSTYAQDSRYYCGIHNIPLKTAVVPIHYGLLRTSKAQRQIEDTHFPNANTFLPGGCCPGFDPQNEEATWYCPRCRKEEAMWKSRPDYPPPPPALPEQLDALVALALSHTDDEIIQLSLDRLRANLTIAPTNPHDAQVAADGYTKIMRKLQSGWPGFSGELVPAAGRTFTRLTDADLIERQQRLLAIELELVQRLGWQPHPALQDILNIQPRPKSSQPTTRNAPATGNS